MNENLAAALVNAQAAMPKVEADALNPHFKTRFVSLDNLIAHTRPVLNKHGLAIVQLPATNDAGLPVLRTMLIHGASGETVTADAPLMLGKNDMQGLGAAITYARRYAWAAALGISEQEDDDGESGAVRGRDTAAQQEPAPVPRPPTATNAKPGAGDAIDKNRHAQIAMLVKELEGSPIPPEFPGAESWIDVLRQRLEGAYNVKSRTELTKKQADELIKWLKDQQIPF